MALAATTVWEVQTGGSDTNGAGCFDPGQTAGMFTDGAATSATGASPVFTSASYNFVAGDVDAWIYIASGTNWIPGWYKVASVAANAATLNATLGAAVKSAGVPTTATGCATTASPTGATWSIDYSQQAASEITYTDLSASGAGLTVSSAGNPFTARHVGNGIVITGGTNFNTGRYVIASVSAGVATVVGAGNITSGASSNGAGRLGGALASPGLGVSLMLASNWCFVKSGTYTVTTTTAGAAGPVLYAPGSDATVGSPSRIEGYGTVRGDNGTKPIILLQTSLTASAISIFKFQSSTNKYVTASNFEIDAGSGNSAATGVEALSNFQVVSRFRVKNTTAIGVKLTDFGERLVNSEVGPYSGTYGIHVLTSADMTTAIVGCYVHTGGALRGIRADVPVLIVDCLVADTGGIRLQGTAGVHGLTVWKTTTNAGIHLQTSTTSCILFRNVIIYGAATYSVEGEAASGLVWFDGCAFGGAGTADFDSTTNFPLQVRGNTVSLTADPFVDSASGDFRLNTVSGGGAACRAAGTPSAFDATNLSYRDIGALQHQDTAGSGTKISALTETTTPTTDDLIALVDDPAGTPITKKATLANLLKLGLTTVTVQTLTSASGTYTPTNGMKKCLVIAVGGGAGGESVTLADEAGGGGGGGGTVVRLFTAAEISGHDGYAVGASASAATTGNNTTFSSSPTLLTAGGGARGATTGNTVTVGIQGAGGNGGTATGGDLNIPGEPGGAGIMFSATACLGGRGGNSVFGAGGACTGNAAAGNNGTAYGGGGSGATTSDDTNRSGGTGAAGVIYVIEFID